MIDRTSGIPAYKQVENSIRADIDNGVYRSGTKMPSEDELAKKLGVSRGTVRQALTLMEKRGAVKRIQGSGTYVSDMPGDFSIESDHFLSFLDALEEKGHSVETEIAGRKSILCGGEIAELFGKDQKIFELRRLRRVDGRPVMYSIDRVSEKIAPDIDQKFDDGSSIYLFLEKKMGVRITRIRRRFFAVSADAETSEMLGIKKGDAVMHIVQQGYDDFGRLIDHADLYILSEKMVFTTMSVR